MSEDTGELLVGVTKNPDGSLNFSHAATMEKELKISDPIVDRLRGSLVRDDNKEKRYQTFQDEIRKKLEAGEMQSWFVSTLNALRMENAPEITQDDIASLQLFTDAQEIQDLRDQYGYDFVRPYFQLTLDDYKKVYEKLTRRRDSNGCLLSGGKLEEDWLTAGIGITLAPSMNPDIVHELSHTIDPNINKRSPSDEVLEEFATYYRETYIPRIYTQTTRTSNPDGSYSEPIITQREVFQNPKKIGATLKGDMYLDKYASAFKSSDAYRERVDQIVNVLEQLEKHLSKPDINKAIYNSKSFYELSHLLDVVKRQSIQ